jgi:biotin transport system substrate-specific component
MNETRQMSLTKTIGKEEESILSQALWVTLFAIATAIGARVEIPHQPIPYTLQTLVVLLAGAFLGARNGAVSQLLYLCSGAAGLPVFAGGSFGVAPFIGPTGGYLLAFPAAAALVGLLLPYHAGLLRTFLAMGAGLVIIFAAGTAHLFAFYIHNAAEAVNAGFLIFTWWDVVKLLAAAMTYHELAKRWPKIPAEKNNERSPQI